MALSAYHKYLINIGHNNGLVVISISHSTMMTTGAAECLADTIEQPDLANYIPANLIQLLSEDKSKLVAEGIRCVCENARQNLENNL